MFDKILIANRGEIALRMQRACKELGISTVAVHSTADSDAMWVRLADESVCIGPPRRERSYLNIPAMIAAGEITGADAMHPGYGFLSENARSAEIVADTASLHRSQARAHPDDGRQDRGQEDRQASGIPVVPGSDGAVPERRQRWRPRKDRLPGAGEGRGRRWRTRDEGRQRPTSCRARSRPPARSQTAFGDAAVYLEKYLRAASHRDPGARRRRGTPIHLGERDCSLQRRHQKVWEEAPSPALDAAARAKIGWPSPCDQAWAISASAPSSSSTRTASSTSSR